ncbi:hypothetical protein [Streptomyces sp. NBC_01727]|uniref:hypothetical protein n=1 Tax=Streptomyces sp. NBC_01727 TaxID=2975924 RepID=UPI002E1586AB|nr:hypothetical protein OIE76_07490 [Streptomyces sp. NBC_01727]
MKGFGWLTGGNDRQLAETKYAGRESASEKADRKQKGKDRASRARDVRKAARAGQAWEDEDRRRERARHG